MQPSLILKRLVDDHTAGRASEDDLWALAIGTVYPPNPPERVSKPRKAPVPLAPYWWLGGTTCHRHTSVAWTSHDERYVLLKHAGHSEWCGRGSGTQYCQSYHSLFDMVKVETLLKKQQGGLWSKREAAIARWDGRWTKARQQEMEKLCNPWK